MVKADLTPKTQPAIMQDWRVHDQNMMKPILDAALDAIVEVGFHGTTIRKIADRAGLSVPGVYHHYSSEHALLVGIMQFGMEDLWARTQAAVAEARGDITREFELYVECMVLFHASRPELASTALNEIRSLDIESRKLHIQRRDRQHRMLDEIINNGCETGLFATAYPRQASTAIITMCTSIAQWFRKDGALTPEELVVRYQDFATKIVS